MRSPPGEVGNSTGRVRHDPRGRVPGVSTDFNSRLSPTAWFSGRSKASHCKPGQGQCWRPRRRRLHITRFRPKAESSLISQRLLSPQSLRTGFAGALFEAAHAGGILAHRKGLLPPAGPCVRCGTLVCPGGYPYCWYAVVNVRSLSAVLFIVTGSDLLVCRALVTFWAY